MKKLLFLTLLFALPLLSAGSSGSSTVYICTGKYSKRYHATTSCKGMEACKGKKPKVTLSQAKEMGKTPCGYCYN